MSVLLGGSKSSLDFRRLKDRLDVVVGDDALGKSEARLGGPNVVKKSNSGLGPDNESTKVGTRGELKKGEGLDVGGLNTRDVLESLDETLVLSVDHKGTLSLSVTTTSELTLTGTEGLRLDDSGNIGAGTNGLQSSNSLLGLGDGLELAGDDKGNLRDVLSTVAASNDERSDSRGSNGRSGSVSLLVVVDLDVPLSPDLGRSKETTATAHVTESSLARSVSTTTTDTGNSGNGTTGTPRLSRGLLTGVSGDGVSLTLVLSDTSPDLVDNIGSDGSLENSRDNDSGSRGLTGKGEDSDLGASGHFGVENYFKAMAVKGLKRSSRRGSGKILQRVFFSGAHPPRYI